SAKSKAAPATFLRMIYDSISAWRRMSKWTRSLFAGPTAQSSLCRMFPPTTFTRLWRARESPRRSRCRLLTQPPCLWPIKAHSRGGRLFPQTCQYKIDFVLYNSSAPIWRENAIPDTICLAVRSGVITAHHHGERSKPTPETRDRHNSEKSGGSRRIDAGDRLVRTQ